MLELGREPSNFDWCVSAVHGGAGWRNCLLGIRLVCPGRRRDLCLLPRAGPAPVTSYPEPTSFSCALEEPEYSCHLGMFIAVGVCPSEADERLQPRCRLSPLIRSCVA